MPRKTAVAKSTRFEDALEELETLVRTLESGEQSLDESLIQFERGVALSRFCRRSLADAERQVKILLEEEDGERLADFDSPASGASASALENVSGSDEAATDTPSAAGAASPGTSSAP